MTFITMVLGLIILMLVKAWRRDKSTKIIPIHLSDIPIDTTQLHLRNLKLHQELGPIYAESLGPDVQAIWIADAVYVRCSDNE